MCFYQFPNGSGGPKPEDDRFWERCLELGIAISPHFGFGNATASPPGKPGTDTSGIAFASALAWYDVPTSPEIERDAITRAAAWRLERGQARSR